MPFTQVHDTPHPIWVPMTYAATVYWGSIAALDQSANGGDEGYISMPIAAGAWNVTNYDVPFGVVEGDNLRTKTYNSTGLCNYITGGSPLASTTEYVLTTGFHGYSAREPMLKVSLIDPTTILRVNLVVDTPGTPPTETTVSTGGSVSATTSAADVATIQYYSTIYFRTGPAMGAYRKLDSAASTTTHTWDLPTYAACAANDTALVINLKHGLSRAQLAATYLNCLDIDAAVTSDYFAIDVLGMNWREAGHETVDFRWNIMNFFPYTDRTASA